MTQEDFDRLRSAAEAITAEITIKLQKAAQIFQQANEAADAIKKAREDLKRRSEGLDLREKKLKYAQLRLLKIVNASNFEDALKKEVIQMAEE